MKFAWTTLRVRDFERSVKFYTEVIGLKIVERLGTDVHRVVMLGEEQGTHVEILWEPEKLPDELGTGVNLGFFPDDLDAFKTNIEQLDKMYDDISIVILSNGKMVYGSENNADEVEKNNNTSLKEEPPKKKGFFARLFGKN